MSDAAIDSNRSRNRYLADNRFYNPPPLRKHRQKLEQEQEQQQQYKQSQRRSTLSRTSSSVASDTRPGSSSDCSISSRGTSDISNLDRFLEYITPVVPVQYFPMVLIFRTGKLIDFPDGFMMILYFYFCDLL